MALVGPLSCGPFFRCAHSITAGDQGFVVVAELSVPEVLGARCAQGLRLVVDPRPRRPGIETTTTTTTTTTTFDGARARQARAQESTTRRQRKRQSAQQRRAPGLSLRVCAVRHRRKLEELRRRGHDDPSLHPCAGFWSSPPSLHCGRRRWLRTAPHTSAPTQGWWPATSW